MDVNELLELGNTYFSKGECIGAIECYEKASQLGSAKAFYKLGEIYDYRFGAVRNFQKALEYYEKASELGCADATFRLASIYSYDRDIKKDYMKAIDLYSKAISQNPTILNSLVNQELFKTLLMEYNKLLTQNNNLQKEIELLKTQVLYQPGGEGYLETEQHFNSLIN